MPRDTDTDIFERKLFYIGYITAPILGSSDTGIDLNIEFVTCPIFGRRHSDKICSDIGLKRLMPDVTDTMFHSVSAYDLVNQGPLYWS
jgi:hypothetical protein